MDARTPKPKVRRTIPEGIPMELREPRAWAGYRLSFDGKRWSKVPHRVYAPHLPASSTDPRTWANFDEAYDSQLQGIFNGVSYALQDGYAGVDLDHCVTESGDVETIAAKIVQRFDTYAEFSPTAGIRIICKTSKPLPQQLKDGDIEAFSTAKFLTMTGHRIAGRPETVNDCTEALHWLYDVLKPKQQYSRGSVNGGADESVSDDAIIERVLAHPKYLELWHGADPYGDLSRSDFTLVCRVAFFVGRDPDRIERIINQSQRHRDKWRTRRRSTSWILNTINNALAKQERFYSWRHANAGK